MTNLPPGDFNMPPGVRASDIPGNRPGDVEENFCAWCGKELSEEERQREDHDGLCNTCWLQENQYRDDQNNE